MVTIISSKDSKTGYAMNDNGVITQLNHWKNENDGSRSLDLGKENSAHHQFYNDKKLNRLADDFKKTGYYVVEDYTNREKSTPKTEEFKLSMVPEYLDDKDKKTYDALITKAKNAWIAKREKEINESIAKLTAQKNGLKS